MIYSMAGAMRVDGNEPIKQRAEWNVYVDAAAADLVLKSGIPMIVPLDASDNVPVTSFFAAAVQAHPDTPALRILGTMLRDPYFTQAAVYFWDPLAAVTATHHEVARLQAARLTIDTTAGPDYGITRMGSTGMPVQIAVSANASAFGQQYLDTLGRTLADVREVISRGNVTSVPPWFSVAAVLPGAPGADTSWSAKLSPGIYALVCQQNRDSALYALAEVTIR